MKIYLESLKNNIKEIIISIMYFFRQCGQYLNIGLNISGGNLDPFFLIAPLELYDRVKNKKITNAFIAVFIPIIFYSIFQMIMIQDIVVFKSIINVAKICVCILIMMYVKRNAEKIDIYKIAKMVSVLMAIFLIISLIFNNSGVLWRFNDTINKYTTTRLQFLYLEPSELGFHSAILVIILFSYLNVIKDKKEIAKAILCIIINLVIIYKAKPFGAIAILACSIFAMLLINLKHKFNKEKLVTFGLMAITLVYVLGFMYAIKSPIMSRAIDTIKGKDSSNSYRVNLSIEILGDTLKDYVGVGCGFGNLNSDNFRENYKETGIVEVLANSYIYYIIEGGLFAIITLAILIGYLTKHTFKEYSLLKVGLLVFLVAYQIFGGHFTSGLTWALYGIIASKFNENNITTIKE